MVLFACRTLFFSVCSARVWLALKQLVDKGQFEKIRFWGKIFGTQKNYYVAEAEQHTDEEADDGEEHQETHDNDDHKDVDDEELDGDEDPLPKSTFKPPQIRSQGGTRHGRE